MCGLIETNSCSHLGISGTHWLSRSILRAGNELPRAFLEENTYCHSSKSHTSLGITCQLNNPAAGDMGVLAEKTELSWFCFPSSPLLLMLLEMGRCSAMSSQVLITCHWEHFLTLILHSTVAEIKLKAWEDLWISTRCSWSMVLINFLIITVVYLICSLTLGLLPLKKAVLRSDDIFKGNDLFWSLDVFPT